jgi:hypothetical protein
MMPAIYDNGTHYVTNQKLTVEMLKEISDSEDVLEVTDEYIGRTGGFWSSQEHLSHKHTHNYYLSQKQVERQRSPIKKRATK